MADMTANTKVFDHYNGDDVYEYSLTNKHGVTLSTLSFGANWYELLVPTAAGKQNLLLNFLHVADYAEKNPYLCMSIGRTAGRIGKGQFTINGADYQVDQNEGKNDLHGGFHGFNSYNWDGRIEDNHIIFTKNVTSDMDGFPGNMAVTITYTLTEQDEVLIDYSANADADTLFNPTNHAYWNLNPGDVTVGNHDLYINSTDRLTLDGEKIPTGELTPLKGTPFDFSQTASLGKAIANLQDIPEKGIDDVYVLNDHKADEPVATLSDPDSGISVDIFSERNAIVCFTANGFKADEPYIGKTGQPHVGVALESQQAPNAVFDPNYGNITVGPNEIKHVYTKYHFSY